MQEWMQAGIWFMKLHVFARPSLHQKWFENRWHNRLAASRSQVERERGYIYSYNVIIADKTSDSEDGYWPRMLELSIIYLFPSYRAKWLMLLDTLYNYSAMSQMPSGVLLQKHIYSTMLMCYNLLVRYKLALQPYFCAVSCRDGAEVEYRFFPVCIPHSWLCMGLLVDSGSCSGTLERINSGSNC